MTMKWKCAVCGIDLIKSGDLLSLNHPLLKDGCPFDGWTNPSSWWETVARKIAETNTPKFTAGSVEFIQPGEVTFTEQQVRAIVDMVRDIEW
jgi:hypothetical protein